MFDICDECDGSGVHDWLEGSRCRACRGTGFQPDDCPDCGGSGINEVYGGHGSVLEVPCGSCGGTGNRWPLRPALPTTPPPSGERR